MNAKDALDKPGLIRIETLPVKAGDRLFTQCHAGDKTALRAGILMRFSDNGTGILEVYRDRIFHSFFTTKEIHKGSGFGLYNIERMIHGADGLIDFRTAPGEGTTFEIFLPEADFTEQSTESPQLDASLANQHPQRPFVVVVGREEVSHYDLITLMRSRNWEVIVFQATQNSNPTLGSAAEAQIFA
jgi:two-component system, cell cycle sensor histidine kinase and response regulator CckA